MQIRHDLLGCAHRLRSVLSEIRLHTLNVQEHWRDSVADQFIKKDMVEIDATIDRLIATTQECTQELGKIAPQIKDDEAY